MILACILVIAGIMLMTLTFLPNSIYSIVVFIGFTVYGIGLGLYATPSTDTAIDNVPAAKAGEAAGIYKMSSTLGGSFGLAISVAVYSVVEKDRKYGSGCKCRIDNKCYFCCTSFTSYSSYDPKRNVNKSIKEDVTESIKEEKAL